MEASFHSSVCRVCLPPSCDFLYLPDIRPIPQKDIPRARGYTWNSASLCDTWTCATKHFCSNPHCSLSPGLGVGPLCPTPYPRHLATTPEITGGIRKMHYINWIWGHSLHLENPQLATLCYPSPLKPLTKSAFPLFSSPLKQPSVWGLSMWSTHIICSETPPEFTVSPVGASDTLYHNVLSELF